MKLITFARNDAPATLRLGALRGQSAVDLNKLDSRIPADMIAFLEGGAAAMALAASALAAAKSSDEIAPGAYTLKAPIPRPGKIICVGLNYRDHAKESGQAVPEFPTVFAKYANTVIGPGEAIIIPRLTDNVDYEAEFGFVIGKRAKHVSEADALSYVAGYLPLNDISARDYQARVSQWTLGKSFDAFLPMGPAITTADEIPDPQSLDISLTIGGVVLQKSNTRELVFGVQQLVHLLSGIMTLEPGDIVSTGTPSGVGAARTPKRWILPGETVTVEIAKLGTLSNPVVKEA